MFDKDIIDGAPSILNDFIKYGLEETKSNDNPPFYRRNKNAYPGDTCYKNFIENCKSIAEDLIEKNPNNKSKIMDRLRALVGRATAQSDLYVDIVLGYKYFASSVKEKVGNVTYVKPVMSWYDMSDKLPELLSLLTGTSPALIRFYMEQMLIDKGYDMTVDEFSRHYLGDRYVPVGYSKDIVEYAPPAVLNFINNFINNGINNDFSIGGKSKIISTPFVVTKFTDNINRWKPNQDCYSVLDIGNLTDIYLCYSVRLFMYYLLSHIYTKITTKYKRMWTPEGATRESQSEMLVAWTSSDIVFQNVKSQVFPSFSIKGRGESLVTIKPYTYSIEDAIRAHLDGTIVL